MIQLHLAVKKPILSISFPGVAEKLIRETNAGIVVRPDKPEAIEAAIEKYFRDYKENNVKVELNQKAVDEFTRENLTRKLANIFDSLV